MNDIGPGDYCEVKYPTACCANDWQVGQKLVVTALEKIEGGLACTICEKPYYGVRAHSAGGETWRLEQLRKLPPLAEIIIETEEVTA